MPYYMQFTMKFFRDLCMKNKLRGGFGPTIVDPPKKDLFELNWDQSQAPGRPGVCFTSSEIVLLFEEVALEEQCGKEYRRERYEKRSKGRARAAARKEFLEKKIGEKLYLDPKPKNSTPRPPKELEEQAGFLQKSYHKAKSIYNILAEQDITDNVEPIADMVENLYLTIQNLRHAETSQQALHLILAHVKLFTKRSLSGGVMQFLMSDIGIEYRNERAHDLLDDAFSYDVLENQASAQKPKWLEGLRSLSTNWSEIMKHEGSKELCKVISMCAAVGLCDISNFQFSYGPLKIFSLEAYTKQVTAADLTTAILETIVHFVEGGYRVFTTGKASSFWMSEAGVREAEDNFFKIVEYAPLVKAGNLKRVHGIDDNDYALILDKAIDQHTDLYVRTTQQWAKKPLGDRLQQLKRYRSDFNAFCMDGGQRIAPYAIYIQGPPGVGKSMVYDASVRVVLEGNGFSADDERIVTIKDMDQFDSTMKSSTNAAILDDFGNTQAQYSTRSPTDRVIDFKNNVASYANMAEADLKGKVRIAIKMLVATSNVSCKSVGQTYSNEPGSVVRRFDVHAKVTVKPEYATIDGRLDQAKVIEAFGQALFPDVLDILIGTPDMTVKSEMVKYYDTAFSFKEYIQFITVHSRKYFANQRAYVQRSHNLTKKLRTCRSCGLPHEFCKLATAECQAEAERTRVELEKDLAIAKAAEARKSDESRVDFDETSTIKSVPSITPVAPYPPYVVDYSPSPELKNIAPLADFDKILKEQSGITKMATDFYDHQRQIYLRLRDAMFTDRVGITPDDDANAAIDELLEFERGTWHIFRYLPNFIWKNRPATMFVFWMQMRGLPWRTFEDDGALLTSMLFYCASVLIMPTPMYLAFILCSPLALFPLWVYSRKKHIHRNGLLKRIQRSRGLFSRIRKSITAQDVKDMAVICVHLYGYYKIIKFGQEVYRRYKVNSDPLLEEARKLQQEDLSTVKEDNTFSSVSDEKLEEQVAEMLHNVTNSKGELKKNVFDDIAKRDGDVNPWAELEVDHMPKSESGMRHTPQELANLVIKNLYFMRVKRNGKCSTCDVLFLKSNYMLMPDHVWENDKNLEIELTGKTANTVGSVRRAIISRATSKRVPGADLSVVYVGNCGTHRNLVDKYFFDPNLPKSALSMTPGMMVYRNAEGTIDTFLSVLRREGYKSASGPFDGYAYNLSQPTYAGMCMGTWISHSKCPTIIGFHLAGKGGTGQGAAGFSDKHTLNRLIDEIGTVAGVVTAPSSGTVLTEQYGKEFFQGTHVHEKSPTRYLTDRSNIEIYGSVDGRRNFTSSEVVDTVISDHVAEVCQVEQQWGKPRFHRWKPYQAALEHSSNPSIGIEGNLVRDAVVDYLCPLVRELRLSAEKRAQMRPLTRMETVCGIDGLRFIDKMKPQTSNGFPLKGKKEDFIIQLDPAVYENFQSPADFEEVVWQERDRIRDCYLNGERGYPIFDTNMKDEATPLYKEGELNTKVRLFQAAPVGFQCLIRQYYLPVARFLSMHPLLSECAVGVNAQGPEWDELARHMRKYGEDRILAGDYSKYDLRMPAQIILAAFDVMIRLAKESGNYFDDDLTIMRGIAADIAYPLSNFNGDYIQFYGSVPSGHNLTAYINSIDNALMIRCAFFHFKEDAIKPFREYCAISTYGDDIKGSVSTEAPELTHLSVAQFLRERDMKFTMPDKTSEPTEYMNANDADFLKRKDVWNEELQCWMGALCEDSIFKSLHAVMRSKFVTPEAQAAQNIDGALREWFAHGKEHYEMRRSQMQEVAKRAEIEGLCQNLDRTYEAMMDRHKQRYYPELCEDQVPPEVVCDTESDVDSMQCPTCGVHVNLDVLENQSGEILDEFQLETMTEEEVQLMCFDHTMKERLQEYPKLNRQFNVKVLGCISYGEIDYLARFCYDGQDYVIIAECKATKSKTSVSTAKKQIAKYVAMMRALLPAANIFGLVVVGKVVRLYVSSRQPQSINIFARK